MSDGKTQEDINKNEEALVILDKTPFYAESGGQIGDSGALIGDKFEFQVRDTQKIGDHVGHIGSLDKGSVSKGDGVVARINKQARNQTVLNHSATHLLHSALRTVLGDHVEQRGSLVNEKKLRFDFVHQKQVTKDEIKKIEAGLYYLRLKDIDHEINLENEINKDAENEVKKYNEKIEEFEKQIKIETEKVEPIREKNIENLSRIQRLNLELQSLDEESKRIKIEIDNIKVSNKTIDKDIDREKSIVIDANSNEKRLKEEKNDLIEIDSKYYETEKLSNKDLEIAKAKLKNEQEKVNIILEAFNSENLKKNINVINEIKDNIIKAKNCIDEQKINDAQILLDECQITLSLLIQNIAGDEDNNKISKINSKNENIKKLQETYADSYSKNQSIKQESLKRNERIKLFKLIYSIKDFTW